MKSTPPCHPRHHQNNDTVETKHFTEFWCTNAINRPCTTAVGLIQAYSCACTCHVLPCHGSMVCGYLSPETILEQMCPWQAFLRHPRLAIQHSHRPKHPPGMWYQAVGAVAVSATSAIGGAIFSQHEGRKAPLCNTPMHPS